MRKIRTSFFLLLIFKHAGSTYYIVLFQLVCVCTAAAAASYLASMGQARGDRWDFPIELEGSIIIIMIIIFSWLREKGHERAVRKGLLCVFCPHFVHRSTCFS